MLVSHRFKLLVSLVQILLVGCMIHSTPVGLWGIDIVVDYRFDTQNFFDTPAKRTALQAAADRYSRIIDSQLLAVTPNDSANGWRIGFSHPGTGEDVSWSTSADINSDPLASFEPADLYGFAGLPRDTWYLFAGGREITSAGIGGTGTGLNFENVFDDLTGPMHRGLIPNTPGARSVNDLPVWGGSITFNKSLAWHFDLATTASGADLDFYSIALHEVGHALGLSTNWNQWTDQMTSDRYTGSRAIAAYNSDHQSNVTFLNTVSANDGHWKEGGYQSLRFEAGNPVLVGTRGNGELQDLLMEPIASFSPTQRRLEITNVDAAALTDLGWSIIPSQPSLDLNGDGQINRADVDLACSRKADLTPYFSALQTLLGDVDFTGDVGFSDFLVLSSRFSGAGNYGQGDLDCNGRVEFSDFLILSSQFGKAAAASTLPVPEPGHFLMLFAGSLFWRRRR